MLARPAAACFCNLLEVAPQQAWTATLPDLRSRLNALPVAELPPPDDMVLEGLLRNFFRERSITPADDLILYLLRRIERSALSALDIVDRLEEAPPSPSTRRFRARLRDSFLKLKTKRSTSVRVSGCGMPMSDNRLGDERA